MIWWYLIVAVAAGAIVWAILSAYLQVRDRMRRAENREARRAQNREAEHQK
ncbi:MAG TPA: hypothetical protein VH596_12165 [Terriglobales bacterium]|jgi:hypothetical protein